ncbi:MAG: alpha/beta hydrolase [Pseudomonadota bacterium]|nr:alpha/beta hydrolase [Pseudomonadota bacterium]
MPYFTTSDGLSLHYTDEGTGTPVLCLAGLTRNGDDFQFVRPHLSAYRMITLDSRGRGKSDFDKDYMNYSLPREAQDALELLAHLQLEKVVILGTSRGGLIAMGLGPTHAHVMQGVILNDIGPRIDERGLARIFTYVGRAPDLQTLKEAAAALANAERTRFFKVSEQRWLDQAAAIYDETPDGIALRYDARLLDALRDQSVDGEIPEMWEFFDSLNDIPMAVIRGEHSDLLSDATVQEMAQHHPGLITCTVPDRGHVPFLDEPEALDAIHAVMKQAETS